MTDSALEDVVRALVALDPDGSRMASTIRKTLDQLYNGQHTGRYRWDQLHKTEKTHCGTLVEINLQREFKFDDGDKLDYRIAGHEVDCKYSQGNGKWMIPNEARDELCLVVTADDLAGDWNAGVVRMTEERLSRGSNRDAKTTLNVQGRADIVWLQRDAELPPNILLHLPPDVVAAIFGERSGQRRINQLFRSVQGQRISRGVVATVARQDDYMKRVRYNGGARSMLRDEGILILGGDYAAHRIIARGLRIEVPEPGEFVSVRVTETDAHLQPAAPIDGRMWRVAVLSDVPSQAPMLPRV